MMEFQSKRPSGRLCRWAPTLTALAALLVAFAAYGCGSDTATAPKRADDPPASRSAPTASPTTHASARAEGRRACRRLTPLEAARRFKQGARRAGASKRFIELVAEPTADVASSPGYPRLVAAFYASTLPPSQRAAAAAACAEELAAESGGKAAP
jgi:hypothetical protein